MGAGEWLFIVCWFGIPGIAGFMMASRRGKNPLLWGVLSGVFPFFLVVLYMHHKPAPDDEERR